ncbi:MAG: molybdopterin-guanine dinucleotide biosynthesis protein B [Spirochaetales bacterium]|nr:molybdopterin-guanine dinucleotide biosynthesis protein B [Spirochaetales bacterium]
MDISIGITAGGRSSRFGSDKRFALYEGKSFLQNAIARFSSFSEVLLAVDSYIEGLSGCRQVLDEFQGIGPIEAIRQLLLASENEHVFILPVDMPRLESDIALFLSTYIEEGVDCICPVVEERKHPLCAIYSRRILPAVDEMIGEGDYRLQNLLGRARTKYVDFSFSRFSPSCFLNVNTREDYGAVCRPKVFAVSGYSNSGKTTLIESLIPLFCRDGLKVGAIKHDRHSFELDHIGTDSYRLYEAGSSAVAIYSKAEYALRKRGEYSLDDIIRDFSEYDVVIVEGEKLSQLPKIRIGEGDFPNVFLSVDRNYDINAVYRTVRKYLFDE